MKQLLTITAILLSLNCFSQKKTNQPNIPKSNSLENTTPVRDSAFIVRIALTVQEYQELIQIVNQSNAPHQTVSLLLELLNNKQRVAIKKEEVGQ